MSYNAKQKEQFIASLPPKAKVSTARVAFNKLSAYESKHQEDACNFNKSEIKDAYKGLNEYNTEYLYRIHNMMRKYTDWCIKEGLSGTNQNEYSNIGIHELSQCVAVSDIISQQQIREWAIELEENPINSFLISAPFYGLSNANNFEEFVLTRDNIQMPKNGSTAILLLPTRKLVIPRYIAHYAIDSIESTQYFVSANNAKYTYIPSECVIKFLRKSSNSDTKISWLIANRYTRLFKPLFNDKTLSFTKVARSGMAYYAKSIMHKYKAQCVDDVYDTKEFQEDVIDRFRLNKSTYSIYFFKTLLNNSKSPE